MFQEIDPKMHLKSFLGPQDPSKAPRELKIDQVDLKIKPLGLQIETSSKIEAVGLKNIKN